MTVAIAALCGFPNDITVIAAEDHMVTSGDVEFEQPQPKMWKLSEHCVAMFYGLSAAQGLIAQRAESNIASKGITEIGVMAESYAWYLRDYIRREAETDVLAPLALTVSDLLRRPATINQTLLTSLTKQLQTYYEGSGLADDLGGALIIGTDAGGAHIYQVEHGHVTSQNSIGFVAAGGGQWHAASQFMFSRYTRWWPFADALSLVYAAKKRAEVAPGVGTETDIVIITTQPPNVIHLNATSDLVQGLERIYNEHKKKQDADLAQQHTEVKVFIDEMLKSASVSEQAAPPSATSGEVPPEMPLQVAERKKAKRSRQPRKRPLVD